MGSSFLGCKNFLHAGGVAADEEVAYVGGEEGGTAGFDDGEDAAGVGFYVWRSHVGVEGSRERRPNKWI